MADDLTPPTPPTPPTAPTQQEPDDGDQGFSTAEKLAGAAAVYKAPLFSAIAADAMLAHETDPVRRQQLLGFRNAGMALWGIGVAIGIVVLIIVLVVVANAGGGSGACRGGIDRMEPPTYQSLDGKHWTATYECFNGGHKTIKVSPRQVPGGGI